jgi:glycosyltransferase involved in cell wall biosynthesis
MRILIFHGYLLAGTGSNVYNARLAEALVRLGHEVHLLSQDRHPEQQPFVDAVGDWDTGSLRVARLRAPLRCTVYRPDIGPLLPVYVADRYEDIEARTFTECSDQEVERYIVANVEAVRELRDRVRPELALANHLVMGPVILARALGGVVPYAVKVHGSALEYTVKARPDRFLGAASEGLLGARGVLVGSLHTALSLWEALGLDEVVKRTRLGPPGVDVTLFRPLEEHEQAAPTHLAGSREQAASGAQGTAQRLLRDLAGRLREHARTSPRAAPASAFARDDLEAATALERLDPARERLVAFVGKLIVSKGVDLLLAAWPLVLQRVPSARLVLVGFGSYRRGLEHLMAALATGQMDRAMEIAKLGAALEDPAPPEAGDVAEGQAASALEPVQLEGDGGQRARSMRYLLGFLDELRGERLERYLAAARGLGAHATFTGRLDHDELAALLPACEAVVVPSTFPESFGMIALEGAACGALPLSAAHSGLLEVSGVLARGLPAAAAPWLSFALDEHAVDTLAERLVGWLAADRQLRAQTRRTLVETVRERFSWEGVARGVIAAALGDLERLEPPRAAAALG